jgi:hypothetical protein
MILLELESSQENEDYIVIAKTPVSSVEMRTTSKEIAEQAYAQLGQRLLETIESELEELKGDLEADN